MLINLKKKSIIFWMGFVLLFSFCSKKNNENTLFQFSLFGLIAYQMGTTIQCTDSQLSKIQANRTYSTGFESNSDFYNWYSVPINYQNSSSHELSLENKYSGEKSHKSWIYGRGPNCTYPENCNHRGYPTIQLHKLPSGGFKTPVYFEMYTYLDMNLQNSVDWFSFATFSADSSDSWRRVVLINMDSKGYIYLMHVPNHNQSVRTFQNTTNLYPMKKWVKISACLDLNPNTGSAKLWQDDVLMSTAEIKGGCSVLEQAHFGLYASPSLSSGSIFNDDLIIREISSCP